MQIGPRNRLARAALAIVFVLVIAWFAAPMLLAPLLRAKLESLAADHLNASLDIGDLEYEPPYTLVLGGARLSARSPSSESIDIITIGRLELTLAQSPFRSGPLLIERLWLSDPKVRVVRLADRQVVGHDVIAPPSPETAPRRLKLSDIFRLRSLTIERGELSYEDRSRTPAAPMVWQNLTANLAIAPQSAADYHFNVAAGAARDAKVSAEGAVNIDTLLLDITKLSLAARSQPGAPDSALPASLQQILQAHDLRGAIEITAKGQLPLRDSRAWRADDVRGIVRLDNGAGSIEFAGTLDRRLHDCALDFTLHDVSHRPPKFKLPIEHANGTVRLAQSAVAIDQLTARHGADEWTIAAARLPLENLDREVRFDDIDVQINFNDPPATYPDGFGGVVTALCPTGPFAVRGSYLYNRSFEGFRNQYDLLVRTETGNLAPTARRIPIRRIRTEAHVTRTSVQISQLAADVFDGGLACTATIDPRRPLSYQAQLTLEDADLAQVWNFFAIEGPTGARITGRGSLTASLGADSPSVAALTSDGEVEITDAQLWETNILARVAHDVEIAREKLGASNAAAVFHIEDGELNLRRLAIHSRALGVQGSGTIDFGGAIDLVLTAAPLGDWEKHMHDMKIPLVGDVAAALAGGFQKMLNTATRQLLYEFRVTGTTADPKFETIPAPILTETTAGIFGDMLKGEGSLIETLRGTSKQKR